LSCWTISWPTRWIPSWDDPAHEATGDQDLRHSRPLRKPQRLRRRQLVSDDLGRQQAQLSDDRNLHALDQHRHAVERGRHVVSGLPGPVEIASAAADPMPVPFEGVDRLAAVVGRHLRGHQPCVLVDPHDLGAEVAPGLGACPQLVLVRFGPHEAEQVQDPGQVIGKREAHQSPERVWSNAV
jgi:hypothetical protein